MKKISLFLCVCILLASIHCGPIYAAQGELSSFETFETATIVDWKIETDGSLFAGNPGWKPKVVEEQYEGVTYNKYIGTSSQDQDLVVFDNFGKVIDSGKLHISYSYMSDNVNDNMYLACVSNYDVPGFDGYNTNITWSNAQNTLDKCFNLYFKPNGVIQIAKTGINATDMVTSEYTYELNTWNKADIIYNIDEKTYSCYVNGNLITDEGTIYRSGLKAIFASVNRGSYIDDLYVREYTDNEIINLSTEGVKVLSDGSFLVPISMSEYVEGASASNFVFTDVDTGSTFDAIDEADIEAVNGKVFVALPEEAAGHTYTIHGEELVGAATGATTTSTLEITVPGTSSDGTSYSYMNEDFESLESGKIPVGWHLGSGEISSSRWLLPASAGNSSRVDVTTGDDGTKALKLSGEGTAMYHYFPSATPVSGKFTVEFDVKREENAGFKLNYALYEDYQRTKENEINIDNRLNFELLSADTSGNLYYQADMSGANTDTDVDINTDWHHIKLAVDMGKSECALTIDSNPAVTLPYTLKGLFMNGIMGVGFNNVESGAAIDNLNVYKSENIYLDEDFNTYSSSFYLLDWQGLVKCDENNKPNTYDVTIDKMYTSIDHGREDYGTSTFAWKQYIPSNGWFDPSVTDLSKTSKADLDSHNKRHTSIAAFGITPAQPTGSFNSQLATLKKAEVESADNYWTAEKEEAGDKVLALAPRLIYHTTGSSATNGSNGTPGQRRLQKSFTQPIVPGTPFTIEFLSAIPGSYYNIIPNHKMSFAISLLEDGEEFSSDNFLLGYTGYGNKNFTDVTDPYTCTLIAPNSDMSFKEALDNNGAGCEVFEKENGSKLSVSSTTYAPIFFLPDQNKLQKIVIKVTPNADGTTKIDYSIPGRTEDSVEASVTVNRDFTKKTFTGFAFDVVDMTYGYYNCTDVTTLGNSQGNWGDMLTVASRTMYVDELKVYETNATPNNVRVAQVNTLDYDGSEASFVQGISNSTQSIDITFSAPVADAIIAKEGMVELKNITTGENVAFTGSLSADKKKYSVVPSDTLVAGEYMLLVSSNVAFEQNSLSQLKKDYVVKVTCVENETGAITISTAKVINPVTLYENGSISDYTYDMVKPVNALDKVVWNGDNESHFIIKGGCAEDEGAIFLAFVYYNSDNEGNIVLADVQSEVVPVEKGAIDKSIDVPETDKEYDSFAVFVWENGTYVPLTQACRLQ